MYSTPLKSKIDKNRASFLLSILIKPEEKIKYAFCTDLLIENSLFNKENEYYFYDPVLIEFWVNYNNNRKYLYSTVQRHIKMDKDIIQDCINNIQDSTPINRSSLTFLSNNLSEGHMYGSEITKEPDYENLPKLFTRTNKITQFKTIKEFSSDSSAVILECLSCVSYTKEVFSYFNRVITESDNIFVLTDNLTFKNKFQKHIHINDQYYLCYQKESR